MQIVKYFFAVDPDSKGGQHLMCKTEFHMHKESHCSLIIARRTKEEPEIPQARVISGMDSLSSIYRHDTIDGSSGFTDGSLSVLTPIDEAAFKRLHLLQGQLSRNVQHVAGLNPKAHR